MKIIYRIERWIEKLVVVGKNEVWKKDRNMYARLLLSMVLAKSFSDPFDSTPPDGSLPPFPSYLKSKLKNIAGPHESFFWRDVYDRLIPSVSVDTVSSPAPFLDFTSTVVLDPNMKETYNLRQLIAEQSRRIEILEEQMNQERLIHQEDVQRLLQHHKSEVDRIRQAYSRERESFDHKRTTQGSNMRRSYDAVIGNKSHAHADSSRLQHSFEMQRTPIPVSHFDNDKNTVSTTSPKSSYSSRKENFDTNLHESQNQSLDRLPSNHRDHKEENEENQIFSRPPISIPISAHNYLNSTMTRSALNTTHADITPKVPATTPSADSLNRSHFYSNKRAPATTVKCDIRPRASPHATSEEVEEDASAHSIDSLHDREGGTTKPVPKSGKKTDIFSQDIPEDDNDFMAYLEKFQTEIRNLQFNIPKIP